MTLKLNNHFQFVAIQICYLLRSGLFIQIVLKTRESVMERTIQYVGIGASIITIVKVRNSISQKACNSKDKCMIMNYAC